MKKRAWIVCVMFISLVACSPNAKQVTSAQVTDTPSPMQTAIPKSETSPSAQPDQQSIATAYPWQEPPPSFADAYPPGYASSPTPGPSQTPGPTATITITPTLGPPTITAIPAKPTPTQAADVCSYYHPDGEVNFSLPNLHNLRWVEAEEVGFPVLRLTGLNMPIYRVVPSPYGSGLALPFYSKMIYGPSGGNSGLLVMEGPGKTPWLAIESSNNEITAYQWIPDNRLIWIDQGKLYTARADGSEKIYYPLPEPASEVWSNGNRAIVSGQSELWRVNLITQRWDKITGIHSITSPSSNASLTPDQTHLLLNSAGMLFQIPLDPSSGPIIKYDAILYGGRGGRIGPPFAIGSAYFFPGVLETNENRDIQTVLFKRGNPRPVPLDTLIDLEDGQFPLGLSVSLDGSWVAFGIYEKDLNDNTDPYQQVGTYLAPTNDLKRGKIIHHGQLSGMVWRTEPAAVIFRSDKNVTQISLPSFREKILGRIDLPFAEATANVTVFWGDSRIALFDPHGSFKLSLDLPYQFDQYAMVVGRNGELYLSVSLPKKKGEQCITSAWFEVLEIPLQ